MAPLTGDMQPLYPYINLRRKGWLIAFIRQWLQDAPPGNPPTTEWSQEELDQWALKRMKELGFYYGTALAIVDQQTSAGRAVFLDTLGRQLHLLRDLRLRYSPQIREDLLPLELSTVLARAVGLTAEAERLEVLHDQLHDSPGGMNSLLLGRRLRDPMRALGAKLLENKLTDDHPLMGSPFHRLLIYCDTRLLVRLGMETFSHGHVRELTCVRFIGENQLQKLYFTEAIIALSWANGVLDPMEQRLIKNLMDIAGFDSEERRLLANCLQGDLPPMDELRQSITDPINRRFLLEQVIFASFIDGEQTDDESRYIDNLGKAFDLDSAALAALEAETVAAIEADPSLLAGFSAGGAFQRLRRHAQKRIEQTIRENLQALRTEIGETSDLFKLMVKASKEKLTPEEQARAKAQLIDICKTIPSLALLIAPGGSIMVPLLMKILPFSLLPSAFDEKDEVF